MEPAPLLRLYPLPTYLSHVTADRLYRTAVYARGTQRQHRMPRTMHARRRTSSSIVTRPPVVETPTRTFQRFHHVSHRRGPRGRHLLACRVTPRLSVLSSRTPRHRPPRPPPLKTRPDCTYLSPLTNAHGGTSLVSFSTSTPARADNVTNRCSTHVARLLREPAYGDDTLTSTYACARAGLTTASIASAIAHLCSIPPAPYCEVFIE